MDSNGWQPALPGLTVSAPGRSGVQPLTTAAMATIDALRRQGLLEPRHTLAVQLVLTLSAAIDSNLEGNAKVTVAVSQAMKQLQDALASLPEPVVGEDDPLAQWLRGRGELMRDNDLTGTVAGVSVGAGQGQKDSDK